MHHDSVEVTEKFNGGTSNDTVNHGQSHVNGNNPMDALLESEEFKQQLYQLVQVQLRNPDNKVSSASQQLCQLLASAAHRNGAGGVSPGGGWSNGASHGPHFKPTGSPVSMKGGPSPMIPINDIRTDECRQMPDEEKVLRCKLGCLYRLVDMHGWTHGIYNHITVRLKEGDGVFLINPFGLLYHEISASNLVKIDKDGNLLERGVSHLGINKAGWLLHSAIHEGRPDINCVLHLHLPDVVAVSCMKCGLLPVSADAEELLYDEETTTKSAPSHEEDTNPGRGLVRYHAYRGIFVDLKERESLVEDLGPRAKVLFLRNHGVAICGQSVEEAWQLTRHVVSACQAQTRLVHLGGLTVDAALKTHSSEGRMKNIQSAFHGSPERKEKAGKLEFEAMMRLLDNAGYRTGYHYQQPLLMTRVLDSLTEAAVDTAGGDESLLNASILSHTHSPYNEDAALNHAEEIRKQVAANRQKASQRSQFLAQTPQKHSSKVEEVMEVKVEAVAQNVAPHKTPSKKEKEKEEKHHKDKKGSTSPTSPVPTIKVDFVDSSGKCAEVSPVLPGNDSDVDARGDTTLKSDAGGSDSERTHKKGIKIGGIRIPSFSRKKK